MLFEYVVTVEPLEESLLGITVAALEREEREEALSISISIYINISIFISIQPSFLSQSILIVG